jgi:hypothetical protein
MQRLVEILAAQGIDGYERDVGAVVVWQLDMRRGPLGFG